MAIVRRILTLLVVLSVAILPVASSAALTFDKPDGGMSAMSTAQPTIDCCDGMPCDGQDNHSKNDCASMAACALHCFNFAPIEFFRIALPLTHASVVPPVSEVSHTSDAGSAPFRPPRA